MRVREYQEWLEAYDKARGWDRIALSHTFLHLVEEIGEISRQVEYLEGYREAGDIQQVRGRLAEELADAATFVFKLSYQSGVDLEEALRANMTKAEKRFSVGYGQEDTQRYLAHQARHQAGTRETEQ